MHIKTLAPCAALLAVLSPLPSQSQTLTYRTSWAGNTFGGEIAAGLPDHKHIQISADDVFVALDGMVCTDTNWDEDGYAAGFYRDGDVRGALEELSHGWGRGRRRSGHGQRQIRLRRHGPKRR